MTHELVTADLFDYLRRERWLMETAGPRYQAVFCDPPYGLEFMGQAWDRYTPTAYQDWVSEWAALMLNFVYPGAVGLFFGGTRTWHRLACGLEDAGWDVVDTVVYMYGSGFPKNHNIGKAILSDIEAELRKQGVDEVIWDDE